MFTDVQSLFWRGSRTGLRPVESIGARMLCTYRGVACRLSPQPMLDGVLVSRHIIDKQRTASTCKTGPDVARLEQIFCSGYCRHVPNRSAEDCGTSGTSGADRDPGNDRRDACMEAGRRAMAGVLVSRSKVGNARRRKKSGRSRVQPQGQGEVVAAALSAFLCLHPR